MERVKVQEGDHLVYTGVDPETGLEAGTLVRKDGTSEEVLSTGSGGDQAFEACQAMGLPNVYHAMDTGHKGPALDNCQAFRDSITRMFGRHRLDRDDDGVAS